MINRKKCVIYLTAVVMLLCAGCESKNEKQADIADAVDTADTKEESRYVETENENKTEPAKSAGTVTNSDDIAAVYRFELDGHSYQLPFPVSELEANGWDFRDGYDEQTMEEMSYVNTSMTDADGNDVRVTVVNRTDQERQLKDCKIGCIMMYVKEEPKVSFETADGISFGSTPDDIKKTYGTDEPIFSESKSQDNITTIQYRFYKGLTDDLRLPMISSMRTDEDTLRFKIDENQRLTGIELQYFGSAE